MRAASKIEFCLNCGDEIEQSATGRVRKYCPGSTCRVAYHRRLKRYNELTSNVTKLHDLTGVLVLELFPGAGLFGRAFKSLGACVVNAGDIMQGYDIRDFKGIAHKFDGVIGGPPCQFASRAAITGTKAINLIPEFVRLVEECKPTWAIMENVREAKTYAPSWDYVFLRDYDCGGYTHRRRGFWFYGVDAPIPPVRREGTPEYSVLASSWNKRGTSRLAAHDYLSASRAAQLQGFDNQLTDTIMSSQPGWKCANGSYNGVSKTSRRIIATHMMGNGVPFALGSYVAKWIAISMYSQTQIVGV